MYYIPLTQDMIGEAIEVFVMGYDKENLDFRPELYITTSAIPFKEMRLVLKK